MNAARPLFSLSALMAALVLAGCANAPATPDAKLSVPTAFKQATTAVQPPAGWKLAEGNEAQARGQWWAGFADATLDGLMKQAQQASPSLAAAAARVQAARSALRGNEAGQLPQVNVSAGATRAKSSAAEAGLAAGTNVPPATVWQAGVGASYEIDLFKRVANSVSAAQADAAASEASYQSVLLALQADVAQTYFQLRTLDADVDVLTRGLDLREQTLQLITKRRAAGDVSELDVARARTDLATTRAELQSLRGTRARTEHALALLLGQAPASFSLAPSPLAADASVPAVPPGLPSSLLERRPDVVAAQAQMRAASARVGQAQAALFPALVLTANGGLASYELRDLFELSTRSWLASAVLSMPLFDGGRNKALVGKAEAQLAESVAVYQQSVLQAFGDVEGQLSTLGSLREQSASLDEALVSARRSAELADKRYRAGEDSYLTLLDAQRSLLAVERQALQLRGAWAGGTVGLVRALGGGWAQAPQAAQAAQPSQQARL
jgi:multidrug efflux system outer membrane protein